MSVAPGTEVLVFSGFSLDPRQRLLFGADGRTVPLTGRAFDTLLYLAEHPHQLIDKQSLMKAVWPNVIVEENNLNQNISIVRRALGETPGENRFVVTVPGRGFRFAPAVTRQVAGDPPAPPIALAPTTAPAPTAAAPTGSAEGPAPEPAQSNAPPASTAALTPAAAPIAAEGALRTGASRSHTRLAWISGSIAGAVVLLVAGYILSRQLWPPSRSVAEVKSSIAVMPFANLTGDAGNDYLGDGMAEEIINVLAKVPGFKVPARTSSFAYKGRNTDIRQIGKDLGVDMVLEGSVRSAGEHIRITAELINAHDGLHVWAQTYDRKFTDLFALQDELAHAIVRTLRGSLSSQVSGNLNREHPTRDLDAYALYLQAQSIYRHLTEESLHRGLELCDQAILRDAHFARALATRARIRYVFVVFGYPLPHALEDAEQDARQALALEPNLPLAYDVLGAVAALRGDWLSAEENFRTALAGDPANPDIRLDRVILLLNSAGRSREVQSQMLQAFRLAPADPNIASTVAAAYATAGLDAEAVRFADLAVELGFNPMVAPLPEIFAGSASHNGRYEEAAERIVAALPAVLRDAGGADTIRGFYAAVADPAKRPVAAEQLRSLLRRVGPQGLSPVTRKWFVTFFASVGALDDAYRLVNETLDEYERGGTVGSAWGALWVPGMAAFRRDGRFQALATRLKLMDYWKQQGPPDGCTLQGEKLSCH